MARSRRVHSARSPRVSNVSSSNSYSTSNASPKQQSNIGTTRHSARIASSLASNEVSAVSSGGDASGDSENLPRTIPCAEVDVTSRTMYNYGYKQKRGLWTLSEPKVPEPRTKYRHMTKPPTCALVSRTTMLYRLLEKSRPGTVAKVLGSGFDKDITLRRSVLDGRKVALASMNMDGTEEERRQRLSRVRKEFDLSYRISRKTKRVVRMHNYCEINTSRGLQAVWTMERASQSLAEFASECRRENGGMLLRSDARSILRTAAKTLHVIPRLHDRNLKPKRPYFRNFTHRDIKGDNFLAFLKARRIKLADLGFASVGSDQLRGGYGTKRFHAPEMISGKVYDARVDVFAYGRMTIELLCGLPFSLDIDSYKRRANARDWHTTKRKAKKRLVRELDDYIDFLTLAGVPPLEISTLLGSPLWGFAALLEDILRYWPNERLSFRDILRAPVMLEPRGGVEVVSLSVGQNRKAQLVLQIGSDESNSQEIELDLSVTSIAGHCVESALNDVLKVPDLPPFDTDSLKYFLLAAFRSARSIVRARSKRNLRTGPEIMERAAFLNLAIIDSDRRRAIRASDALPEETPYSRAQARAMLRDVLPVPEDTASDKELDSDEESDSPMSFPSDVVSSF